GQERSLCGAGGDHAGNRGDASERVSHESRSSGHIRVAEWRKTQLSGPNLVRREPRLTLKQMPQAGEEYAGGAEERYRESDLRDNEPATNSAFEESPSSAGSCYAPKSAFSAGLLSPNRGNDPAKDRHHEHHEGCERGGTKIERHVYCGLSGPRVQIKEYAEYP